MKKQQSVKNKHKNTERWLLTGGTEQMKQKNNEWFMREQGKEREGNIVYWQLSTQENANDGV